MKTKILWTILSIIILIPLIIAIIKMKEIDSLIEIIRIGFVGTYTLMIFLWSLNQIEKK